MHVIVGLYTGGAESMLCKLLEQSDKQRFEHSVVTLLGGGSLRARALQAGARVHQLDMRRNRVSLSATTKLVRRVRKERPDLVQGWMYHGNLAAVLCSGALRFSRPVAWNIRHSLYDLRLETKITRAIIRVQAPLSRLPAAIIYNSEIGAKQHAKFGFCRRGSMVIPNGFDCDVFRPRAGARLRLCEELGVPSGRTLIGTIARYHPMKDHGNLIRAAASLAERNHVQLILVGDGLEPPNRELGRLVQDAGIGDRVSLLGERHDVPEIMAGLDVLVLPSAWGEAFPQVIGEAMATGLPCIATDVGDSRLIIGDTGTIVPPRDAAALAQALARMLELGADGRRRLGERARARVVENFSLRDVVRRYEELYAGLADQRRGRRSTGGR